MSNQSLSQRVEQNLEQAIASGLLPAFVQDKAEGLLKRIKQPVRLAVLGMPGSGKSSLINLLVGADVLTLGVSLPTLKLSYGAEPSAICTLSDGTRQVLDHVDMDTIAALQPVFVDLRMPLPALTKISVLEVVAPDDPSAVHKASQWAAKRCDIAIWCTRGYLDVEQQIWATMPEDIKDHGFCLLTRADLLAGEGLLETAFRTVRDLAEPEFAHVMAIGTAEALAARGPDGAIDKDRLRQSGGIALISAVKKQVDGGKQSAVDMADVLLHQYADALTPKPDDPAPEVAAVDEAETPVVSRLTSVPMRVVPTPPPSTPKTVQDTPSQKAQKPEPLLRPVKPEATPDEPADKADAISKLRAMAAQKAKAREPKPASLSDETRAAYKTVIEYVEEQAQDLGQLIEAKGDAAMTEVIKRTVDHIQWLCDYLNENGNDSDPALRRARDTAYDAADLAQLMKIEKRESAALETVSMMLQLKRELQADLAA